jgi:hypothetical protein
MSDETLNEQLGQKLGEAAEGINDVRRLGLVGSVKQSVGGWREMVGMTLGFAVFVDLMFIIFGILAYEPAGLMQLVGAILMGIGGFGLLEKALRRMI